MMLGLVVTTVMLVASSSVLGADPTDSCYQRNVNCFVPGELEIGHTTYLPDIEVCENACRSLADCKWFTWRETEDFPICYFMKDCPNPRSGAEYTSAKLADCSA